MRDDERYPIVAGPPVTWESIDSGSSLPQVSVAGYHGDHHDKYLNQPPGLPTSVSETPSPVSMAPEKLPPPKRRTVFGLRKRVFWSIAGVVSTLVIIGVVVGAVIGSRHSDSSSSVTADSTMTANQRHIGAATMNITGSMTTNVQVVYQDLETTDLLYRLVWDDQAAPEQRILSLDPSPQQKTPIAVTSANTTSNDGVVTDVFYLSANKDNSSLSDICHVTMQCALGAENCTVSASVIISDGALQGVLNNSGLAAALLPGSSAIRVYYKNGGRAIRSLVGNSTANNSWGDSYVGSQAVPHSSISVNVDQNEDTTLQVVFVNLISKEMEEITYSDAAGVGTNTASIVTSSAPPGWKPAARFSTCFQPGLNQHHIYYVDSTGDIHGLFRGDSSVNWTLTQLTKGTAVGGVASVAWDSQVRLLYMAGDPLTLSMSANNNSVWSNVQAL